MTEVLYFTARSMTLELMKSDEVVVQSRWQANTDVNTAQPKSRSSEFTCSHKSSNLVKKNNHDDAGQIPKISSTNGIEKNWIYYCTSYGTVLQYNLETSC